MTSSSSPLEDRRKRGRQDLGAGKTEDLSSLPSTEPTREARIAWNDDFPRNFLVCEKIGEGSFGTVWTARRLEEDGKQRGPHDGESRGEEERDQKLVALKRINPTCSPSRILNEFNQMRRLGGGGHNVIEVQGVVRTPGGVFALVMPFFEHDDFRQVMKTLTLSGVAMYLKSLLTALAHVHSEGVIHRDVKPRNFMYNARTGQGYLIDFGLAEPAEKWRSRSAALAKHRDRRAARGGKHNHAQQRHSVQTTIRTTGDHGKRPSSSSNSNRIAPGTTEVSASGRAVPALDREEGDRTKLLRKAERGGTTGFRAPEILWHCRDQEPAVDVWSAGVILLCLLSRRYPVFPSADTDEMALVQIAQLLGGSEELVKAARDSGRCHIMEFPSSQLQQQRGGGGCGNSRWGSDGGRGSRLEELCAPLLCDGAAAACSEKEVDARADAFELLKGMLKVDPRERLSAKDALMHPFVAEA
ncbi:unnamed protein product [Ectocarpus sp. CCAP 1310/34]|nr:unnamed protein product [Ectocarpus sp. CCAP 1310/34]